MNENLNKLKQYIEKDLKNKSIDFFSKIEMEKTFISTTILSDNQCESYDEILINILNQDKCLKTAIIGNGGQGKTQFLKKIYSDLFKNNKYPIFISLQNFGHWENKYKDMGIIDYIKFETGFDINQVESSIISEFKKQSSDYYLLLDGLDEYSGDIINLLNNEISQLSLNINIILSSRNTHTVYLTDFDVYSIKEITDTQIKKYLLHFFDKNTSQILFDKIEQKEDIYNLAKIPLFLALICQIYKNNPNGIDNIHSKSDFIAQIFNDLCDEKQINNSERNNLLDEYYKIAFDLKSNNEIKPSENALKLQLLIPSNNSYQFIHKLFEDYYSAKFISKNKSYKFFFNPKNNNYRIFNFHWKQALVFWFGANSVSLKEKTKLFKQIYKFKDKTSGWYTERNFLLCCEILGEFKECPEKLQNTILKKLIKVSEHRYDLTDSEELKRKQNRNQSFIEHPHESNLINAIFNTNKKMFCEILFKKLKKAWKEQDKKAPMTCYISRLSDLKYNTLEFKELLPEIYNKNYAHFSSDMYKKAFECCAYNDEYTIQFFIERLENPEKYGFDEEHRWSVSTGIIDILSKIVPKGSLFANTLYDLFNNEDILCLYKENKSIFKSTLASFLKRKLEDEEKLKEIKNKFSDKNLLVNMIENYIAKPNSQLLINIASYLNQTIEPVSTALKQALNNIGIEKQKEFLKVILFDENYIDMQKSIICLLGNYIYNETTYIIDLFNEVKNNSNHILDKNLLCLSYVVAMFSKENNITNEAINILEKELKTNPNNHEIIHWMGGILQNQDFYKLGIINFLKKLNPTENEAIFEKIFYTTLEDKNKIELKQAYMKAILNKNNKKDRDNLLCNLYQNSKNCENNDDVIEFMIKLIKSLPLKNNLYGNIVLIKSRLYTNIFFKLGELKNKINNKTLKQVICNIANFFINKENRINNKYFNYQFHHLDKTLTGLLLPKDYENVLKQLKKERFEPVLSFLAYEMSYLEYYKIYHPIRYFVRCQFKKFINIIKPLWNVICNFLKLIYKPIIVPCLTVISSVLFLALLYCLFNHIAIFDNILQVIKKIIDKKVN